MNKNFKIFWVFIIFALLFNVIVPFNGVKASSIDDSIIFQSDTILVQIVEENNDYQKVKFTYLDTDEIEYLEYYNNDDGESVYNLTESDGITTHVIKKEDNEVYMDDQLVLNLEDQDYSDSSIRNARSTWKKYSTLKYSSSIYVNTALAIAGLIACATGVPITGFLITLGSYIVSVGVKTIYYSVTYYQSTTTYGLGRQDINVYRYSNYTGLIKSGSYQYYYARPY